MPRNIATFVDTDKWVETTCLPRVKVNTKRFPTGIAMIGRKRASDADKNHMGCITTCEKDHPVSAGLNVIGRDKASDVIIKNYSISRIHAIITIVDENQHFISDFNSFNGTKQNGVTLSPLRLYPLSDNDKLMFGEVEAIYRKGHTELTSTEESQTDASQSIFEAQTQQLKTENVGNEDTGESSRNGIGPPVNESNPLPNSTSEVYDKEFHEAPTQVLIDAPPSKEKTPACSPLHVSFHEAETQIINSQELQLLKDGTSSVANDDSNSPNENVNEDISERETSETINLKVTENVDENNVSLPHSEITHGSMQTVNHSQDSNKNVDENNASLPDSEITHSNLQTVNHSENSNKSVDENNAALPHSEIAHGNLQTVNHSQDSNKNVDENKASLPHSEITKSNLQTVNHSQDTNKNVDENKSLPYSEIAHGNLQTVQHSQGSNKNVDENDACSPHSGITHGSDSLQTVNYSQDSNSSEDFLVLHNKAQEAEGHSTQAVETKSNTTETVLLDKKEEKDDSKIEEHEQEDTTNNRSLSSTPSESKLNDKVESDCETDVEESIFITTNKTNDFTGIISETESEALNDTDVIPATQEVLSEVFGFTKKSKVANNTTESEEDSFRLGLTQMMSDRVSAAEENDRTQTKTDESDIHLAPTQRWSREPICKDQSDEGEDDTSVDRIYIMPTQKIDGYDDKDSNRNVNDELDNIYFQPTQKINSSKEEECAFPKNTHQQSNIYSMETQKLDIHVKNSAEKSDKIQETQEFRGYDQVQDVNPEVSKKNTPENKKLDDVSLTAAEQPNVFLMETQILDMGSLGKKFSSNIHSEKQSKTDSVEPSNELPKNDELQNQESTTSIGRLQTNLETLDDVQQEVPSKMLLNKDGQGIEKTVKCGVGSKSDAEIHEKSSSLFLKPPEIESKKNSESEKDHCPVEVIKTSSKNTRSKANTPHKLSAEKEVVTSTRAKRKCSSVYKTNEESSEPTTKITKTSEDTSLLEKRTCKQTKMKSTLSDDSVAKSKRETNSALTTLDLEMSAEESSSEPTPENRNETTVSPKVESFSNKNKKKSLYDLDEYVEELENDVVKPKPKKILKLPDSQSSRSSSLSDFEDSIIKPKPKRVLKLPDTQTSQEPSMSSSKHEISPPLDNRKDCTEKDNKVAVEKSEQGLKLDVQPTKESSPKEGAKTATKRSRRTLKPNIPEWKPESPPESTEEIHATVDKKSAVKRSRKTVKSNVPKIELENLESDEEKHSTKDDGRSAAKMSRRTLRSNIPNPEITPESGEEKHCPKEDSKPPIKRSRRTLKSNVPKLEPGNEKQSITEEAKPVVEKPKRAVRSKVADTRSESSLECSEDKPAIKEEKKSVIERSRRSVKSNVHSSKSETSSPSSDEKHSFREDSSFLAERSKRTLKPKVVFTLMDDPTLESVIRQLGGSVVDTVEASTVLVTEKVKRTQKLLSAIGYSKPVCSPQWIRESKKASKFLDPWNFILTDSEAETKWNFSLLESLKRSSSRKLLDGFVFHIVMNNAVDVLKSAIESCGGKCINKITKKDSTKSLYIVSSPEMKNKYSKIAKQHEATVIAAEAIFDGVLRQELKFQNHLLP